MLSICRARTGASLDTRDLSGPRPIAGRSAARAALARVLAHALDDTDEQRWRPPLADLTFDEKSPFFVGREVATIAQQSHLTLVQTFLGRLQDESSAWAATMAREGGLVGRDPESQMRLKLAAFERGINEPPYSK